MTVVDVARHLGWTRYVYVDLDTSSRGMAVLENKAHLDYLVAQGSTLRNQGPDGSLTYGSSTHAENDGVGRNAGTMASGETRALDPSRRASCPNPLAYTVCGAAKAWQYRFPHAATQNHHLSS